MDTPARVIVGIPAQHPDLLYACRFDAPDPIICCEHRGRRTLVLSDLEFDRGEREADVHAVLPLSQYVKRVKQAGGRGTTAEVIAALCRERRIRSIVVPEFTPIGLVDALRALRMRVRTQPSPFFPQRLIKTPAEIRAMGKAMRITFRAIDVAAKIIRASRIGARDVLHWHGAVLTAERIKAEVTAFLVSQGYSDPAGMIIACGNDSAEPHNAGSGPLKAHQSIIVDIFPRDGKTFFYGDATRTFVRGRASDAVQRMHAAVAAAQRIAFRTIRDGVNGKTIHTAIQRSFAAAGFSTGVRNGRRHGFFHGTGHGLGLAIHEEPLRINASSFTLRAGHVVTVEPGLYYHGIGGVRLEDVIVVTKTACRLLATSPNRLDL